MVLNGRFAKAAAVMMVLALPSLLVSGASAVDPSLLGNTFTCLFALTEITRESTVTMTDDPPNLSGVFDPWDGFEIRRDPYLAAAYFDHVEHVTTNGQITSITYLVTGVTEQVGCALTNILCLTELTQDEALVWAQEALAEASGGEPESISLPPGCVQLSP